MVEAFARLLGVVFPSVTSAEVRTFLNEFWQAYPPWASLYTATQPAKLCQGDIVGPVLFIVQDDNGDFGEILAPAMVLSHSCDIEDENNIVVAACFSFELFRSHRAVSDIKNNTFFSLLYLEQVPKIGDIVVDLTLLQSVRRELIARQIAQHPQQRIASLTQLGYYFFIAKLTVSLLRAKPADEGRTSDPPPLLTRVASSAKAIRAVARYAVIGPEPLPRR